MIQSKNFQLEIEKHLIDFKTSRQYLPPTNKKVWLYHDMADNLFPPIKHGFLQYVYDKGMPLHDYISHVRSSQAFGINLLYPLLINEPTIILNVIGNHINKKLTSIIEFEFEYSSDKNLLGEWKSDENRPEEYVTATDLFLKAIDERNKKVGILIEIKFSEIDFTSCGGYTSRGNTSKIKDTCNNGQTLLNDFNLCYLHGSHGSGKLSRKYFDYFNRDDFEESSFKNVCPFIFNHQCLRNQALLRAIQKNNIVDYGYFVLVSHDRNESIIEKWEKYSNILSPKAKSELVRIFAGEFIEKSSNLNYKRYFKDRYLL